MPAFGLTPNPLGFPALESSEWALSATGNARAAPYEEMIQAACMLARQSRGGCEHLSSDRVMVLLLCRGDAGRGGADRLLLWVLQLAAFDCLRGLVAGGATVNGADRAGRTQ